jgi:VWFA-related protein
MKRMKPMKKLRAALCALVFASCPAALLAQGPAPSPFGERVDVSIVNVEAWVTDKDGNPVNGLQRGDFEVREDGKPVEVVNFEAFRQDATPAASPAAAPSSASTAEPRKAVAAPEPLHLVIYVENTFLLPQHRNRVLKQLQELIGQLQPADEVMLASDDPGLHIRLPFTHDRAALARAVEEAEKASALGINNLSAKRQAMDQILTIREVNQKRGSTCPPDIAQPAHSYAGEVRADVLRSLGSMTVLVNSLSGIPGRKALLLVSDGMPVMPGEDIFQILIEICGGGGTSGVVGADQGEVTSGDYDGRQAALDSQHYSTVDAFQALTAHANAQRVTLYTLQASGLEGNSSASAEYGPRERILQFPSISQVERINLQNSMFVLASDTGGRAILNANDMRPDFARMQQDFAAYYSLAYSPAHSSDGRQHRIEVRVKRPGAKVRYRQSYRDKRALERTVDRMLASLYYGYEDNPLEIQVEVGDKAPVEKGSWSVPIRLRIPLFRVTMLPTEKSFEGKVRLLLAVGDGDGRQSPVRQVQVPISVPREKALTALGQYYLYAVTLTLKPGEQHVAIAVRDEATATTSFIARNLSMGPAGKPPTPVR